MLSLLLSLACQSQAPVAGIGAGIAVYAPTREERLTQVLQRVDKAEVHATLFGILEDAGGLILVDAPDRVGTLPDKVEVQPLFDATTTPLLWGTEEKAAAEAIRGRKARFVLLHRDANPSVDRGKWVISRLYHDDYRERFTLAAVDDHYLLYAVRENPLSFPPPLAKAGADTVRALLAGRPAPTYPDLATEDGRKWNLIASLRYEGGRELALGMCLRESFRECAQELAVDLEREHRRSAELLGMPKVKEDADKYLIDIHRVVDRAVILTDDEAGIEDIFEPGIDGGIIQDMSVEKVAVMPGAVSYTRGLREADKLLREAARQFSLGSVRPWRDEANALEKIRTIHYLDWPEKGIVPLFRGVAPVPIERVDLDAVKEAVVRAGGWYMANLAPNEVTATLGYQPGQVVYKMWPSENRYSDEYNIVRHTLATWNLVQAWRLDPRPEFLEGARRNLEHTMRFRKDEGDRTWFEHNDGTESVAKLGTVVVQLMGMIDLARATGSHEWDDVMVRMGNFTLSMQEESGKFTPYFGIDAESAYADEVNDIVPGEAALALVMLYEYTGDKKWLAPLPKFFEYYTPWWDERVKLSTQGGAWPRYAYPDDKRLELVQFGPWSVMAANAWHKASGDPKAAEFGLRVARWMVETYQWDKARAPWPDYVGGFFKMVGETPAMQAFCYGEGISAAYALALRAKPDEVPFFRQAAWETVRFGVQMEYDPLQVYAFPRGDEVVGGTRYAMTETKVRIDYTYHSQSAMVQFLEAAAQDPNLPEDLRQSPVRRAAAQAALGLTPTGAPAPATPPAEAPAP